MERIHWTRSGKIDLGPKRPSETPRQRKRRGRRLQRRATNRILRTLGASIVPVRIVGAYTVYTLDEVVPSLKRTLYTADDLAIWRSLPRRR